jgi:hypothetical protein
VDTPGSKGGKSNVTFPNQFQEMHAREFVRLKIIDPFQQEPFANMGIHAPQGSRCSYKIEWRSVVAIKTEQLQIAFPNAPQGTLDVAEDIFVKEHQYSLIGVENQ